MESIIAVSTLAAGLALAIESAVLGRILGEVIQLTRLDGVARRRAIAQDFRRDA